jgi:predicted metal-dependent HD superfamily phosphohydrolase
VTADAMHTDLSRWQVLWVKLAAHGAPIPWHERLVAGYNEATRHYHNLRHLEECLTELDRVRSMIGQPVAVEAALWFHDAVYDPRSTTNEEDSAAAADQCLTEARVARVTVDLVCQLVLCTKTHEPAGVPDAAVLIDIDLAILGQPAGRFREYERAIRAEYAWVPEAIFAQKRAAILTRFLERPAIYRTEDFRARYESTARENLGASLARLRAISP